MLSVRFLGAAVCAAVAMSTVAAPVAAHSVGEIVPFVSAEDLDGRELNLGELVAARRVAIVFWDWRRATSTRSLTLLDELRARYAARGLEVVAIEGEGSSREAVADRVARLRSIGIGISYRVVPDPGGKIVRQFGVESTPQVLLLDGAGRVAFHLETFGAEEERELVEAVRELVGDLPPHPPSPLVPARRSEQPPDAAPPAVAPPPKPREVEDPRLAVLERHRYFGGYHFNRGEFGKAEESYRKYLALAPEDVEVWNRYGEVLARLGAYDRAREAWEQVLRIEPGNPEADAQIRRLIRGEY